MALILQMELALFVQLELTPQVALGLVNLAQMQLIVVGVQVVVRQPKQRQLIAQR